MIPDINIKFFRVNICSPMLERWLGDTYDRKVESSPGLPKRIPKSEYPNQKRHCLTRQVTDLFWFLPLTWLAIGPYWLLPV